MAAALPHDRASVVIMDEVPYLMDADGAFEGMLQRAWDRVLETKPVLLQYVEGGIPTRRTGSGQQIRERKAG